MALKSAKNVRLYIGGYDVSGKSNKITPELKREFKDVTGFGEDGHRWHPLLLNDSFSFDGFYDNHADIIGLRACLDAYRKIQTTVCILLGTTLGDQAIGGLGKLDKYNMVTPVSDMITLASNLKFDDRADDGAILLFPKATKTSDGNHTVIDSGQAPIHKESDVSNIVDTAKATDLPGILLLLNEIKADYNTHRVSTTYHDLADNTNVVSSADATTLATAITLANEIKTEYNDHREETGIHPNDDTVNVVSSANASDLPTCIVLSNEIKLRYNNHLKLGTNGAIGYLQVFACGADDDLIVKIQHSNDNFSGDTTDLITFTTATGLTSERKTVTGTIKRYARVLWSGTPTYSATFAVIFKRL